MYKLKQLPEDFIVVELSNPKIEPGIYHYFRLRKRMRNTLDTVREIGRVLHLNEKCIGFAGSKDKHAVTEQTISITKRKKEDVLKVKIIGVELTYLGMGKQPITLGDLEGNFFEIVVRQIEKKPEPVRFVANYFDEQRFSSNNKEIGRLLVKKRFKEALTFVDDEKCTSHLHKHKRDFIGALKRVPKRLVKMYVHAYQSYLFNEILAEYLKMHGRVVKKVPYSLGEFVFVEGKVAVQVPLIGFSTEVSGEIAEITEKIMQREEIMYRDFIIKPFPELSMEGDMREGFVDIGKLRFGEVEDDELIEGKKVTISFVLPKGSYATMVVKKLFQ